MLGVRLARMRALIEPLEAECSRSAEQPEMFQVLKRELDEARRVLQSLK
jgi:hypothetical protein